MRHFHPRQNQKPGVVGEEPNVAPARLLQTGVQETSPRPVFPSLVWILTSTNGEDAWTPRLPQMTSSGRMGTWTGIVSIRVIRIAEL